MARNLVPFQSTFPRTLDLFRREMDEMFENFFGRFGEEAMEGLAPRTNLVETESEYEATVELPGLKPDEFHVDVVGNELWITGERKQETEEKGKTYHRVERHFGKFRRVLSLPGDFDADRIDAQYKDGILRITVPKVEAAKSRRIEVKS